MAEPKAKKLVKKYIIYTIKIQTDPTDAFDHPSQILDNEGFPSVVTDVELMTENQFDILKAKYK
jgi:hypothetical protein